MASFGCLSEGGDGVQLGLERLCLGFALILWNKGFLKVVGKHGSLRRLLLSFGGRVYLLGFPWVFYGSSVRGEFQR